jgi:hypothetical protein
MTKNTKTRISLGEIFRIPIVLIGIVLLAYLLLSLVYCIPTSGRMQDNMTKSATFFKNEGDYPDLMSNYNSRLDNWTDIIMLLEASNEPKRPNPFVESLKSEHLHAFGKYPLDIIIDKYLTKENKLNYGTTEYARYWHGYLLTLKPLLFITDYGTIRSINSSIIAVLFSYLIYLFLDRKEFIIPFLILFLFLNPVSIMLSLQFSTVTIITLVSVIVIKRYFIKIREFINYVFLLIGSLTGFFDFLTFPILSLGVPLLTWIILNEEEDFKKKIVDILKLSFYWLLGYSVMWSSKWVLASLFTDYNVIVDAIEAAKERLSDVYWDDHITLFDTLYRNLGVSFQPIWFLMVVGLFIRFLFHKKAFISKESINTLILCLVVGLFPFLWSAIVKNHTYSHCFFTFRIFGISVFAYSICICFITKNKKNGYKEK